MAFDLVWMPPEAPYMPVATAGLLSALERAGEPATAYWREGERVQLRVETELGTEEVGELLADAAWPDLDKLPWPDGTRAETAQAIKPVLATQEAPADTYRAMVASASSTEQTFLRSVLTDGALDDKGLPSRSRLLRGVKSDLSGIRTRPKEVASAMLAAELSKGPDFRKGQSGLGLGLVPEVQTFGGTTGPDASTVGAYSPLLYVLLWLGVMALPPVGVARGPRRSVGGPLVTAGDVLSWPLWHVPTGSRALRSLFSLEAIHADVPDSDKLSRRGISAVYRARAVELSTMVAVYRWGRQIAQ